MSLLGQELVTNGDFSVDSAWTKGSGWSIDAVDERAEYSGGGGELTQEISITSGASYQVVYTVDLVNYGNGNVSIGGTDGTGRGAPGTYTETIVAGSDSDIAFFSAGSDFYIDDVSVKEISTADTIEKALFDLLRLDSTVSGIVSSRVYPQIVPQNTSYPALRYNQISGVRDHTISSTVSMVPARFQIDCYGSNYAGARTLSDAVRGVLNDYTGTVGSIVIQNIHMVDESDGFDETIGIDQLRRYSKRQDYMIWYNE